ncbi:hypothetical protein NDU88_002768 [Pleurodeles waltl]|uniref:Uncharacterized protein n=1 Tax=Pleurodeles waltl TaxID=8319 RepID=A0AAV7LF20_PLEWA|nr:hypothetical protein NDU88_002768 [Pleurodeles waltl]
MAPQSDASCGAPRRPPGKEILHAVIAPPGLPAKKRRVPMPSDPLRSCEVGQETENGPSKRNGEKTDWACLKRPVEGGESRTEKPESGGVGDPDDWVRSQKQCRARRRYRLRQRGGREAKLIADPDAWGLGQPLRRPQRERDWREARRPLSVPQRPVGEITKAVPGKAPTPAPAAGRKRGKIDLGPGTEEDPRTGE